MILVEQNPITPGLPQGPVLINGEDINKRRPLTSRQHAQRVMAAKGERKRHRGLKAAAVIGAGLYLSDPDRRAKAVSAAKVIGLGAKGSSSILVDMHRHGDLRRAVDEAKIVAEFQREHGSAAREARASALRAGYRHGRKSYKGRREARITG